MHEKREKWISRWKSPVLPEKEVSAVTSVRLEHQESVFKDPPDSPDGEEKNNILHTGQYIQFAQQQRADSFAYFSISPSSDEKE